MADNSEDSDVLMIDPCLDYINDILMEEGMDDATCMWQVDNASYQSIYSGFCDILGEYLPPNLLIDSQGVFDPHDEQHVKVVNPNDGFYSMINEPRISLPANCHPLSSFQQAIGFTPKHDSGFQGHVMAGHTPLNSTQSIGRLHGMKNDMYNSGAHLNSTGLNAASVSLSSTIDTMAQISVKLNDVGNFKLPSVAEEFSSKHAEVDLPFEDLKLNAVYTDLYFGEPSSLGSSTRAAKDIKHTGDKKKSLAVAGNGSKSGNKRTSEVHMFVDLREVLVSCAQAVAIGDVRRANEILQELRQVHSASANGNCLQRTAHFFSEALAARLRGTGEQHFRAISHNIPSASMVLRASKVGFEMTPFLKVMHYFANQSILKVADGASRLHVVAYGFSYGMQWPCLINALANRKGGPPLLVITGIEFPQPGINMALRLEESGRRLAAYAKTYDVPFRYHAVVTSKWEDLDAASLHLHEGEILVLNCLKRLRRVADEVTDLASTISPRQKLLTCMHSLNPHLLVTAVLNAGCNSPYFVSRFREALYYYSNYHDILDTVWGDTPERFVMERSCCYRDIVNIVACEGAERVERPETYRQWHARIAKAGFEQLPIPPTILSRSRSHVKQHHHKDFLIHDDANGWMFIGWKGQVMLAISAWKPSLV